LSRCELGQPPTLNKTVRGAAEWDNRRRDRGKKVSPINDLKNGGFTFSAKVVENVPFVEFLASNQNAVAFRRSGSSEPD
jgi:hypothetical protein